ncbi:class I SAM-dependent methyltransferase [Aeromicrobium sp.]|uniref:SAM-dependent methyltransferase n=1 Tax=Aeromicrobium sp. TaxID=1871063 RepID=UPI0030C624E5
MTHEHTTETHDFFSQAFWDERYGSEQVWSGEPNPHLVTYASDLRPGTALDLGCGEGADVIWLAQRGWQVTGLDVSPVALDGAARRAVHVGVDALTTWQQADAFAWSADAAYDLVSAQFMHFPRATLTALHRELAASVAPGGTLLIVGHHPHDVRHSPEGEVFEDIRFTAEEAAASLDPADWQTIDPLTSERAWTDRDGHPAIAVDAVLRAVRQP